jgi:hypothetical protein
MRARLVTLCLVAGGLAGCALSATLQSAKSGGSCLQDVRSSQEGQMVYAKLWASDATDTSEKLSDPNPLTPTERDALTQVHNNIISCRQSFRTTVDLKHGSSLIGWIILKEATLSLINW